MIREEKPPPDLFFDKIFAILGLLIVALFGTMLGLTGLWFPFSVQCFCFLINVYRLHCLFSKPPKLAKFWEYSCYFYACAATTMLMLDYTFISFIFWVMAISFWTRIEIVHRA